jgi:bifunctional non-homologous end joining protein LigD
VQNAVVDGEIVCLDEYGRSLFNDLLFRRGTPFFYAFDLLWLNGEDMRRSPLVERKARLKSLLPKGPSRLLFVDHFENEGVRLFESACALDLEGIVAKRKASHYHAASKASRDWIKIKNSRYNQAVGRDELFERR